MELPVVASAAILLGSGGPPTRFAPLNLVTTDATRSLSSDIEQGVGIT